MARALLRLAFADLRRRRLQAALTVLVVAAAAATIAIAVAVGRIADRPWERTFEQTNGPHVVAMTLDPGIDLGRLARQEGVVEATGPRPAVVTTLGHEGKTRAIRLQGFGQDPPLVDRPSVVSGTWLRRDGVVLERSFGRALGLRPGDRILVAAADRPVRIEVVGLAVTATQERYPQSQPGLGFVLRETLERIQPDPTRREQTLVLRLDRPERSSDFVARARHLFPPGRVLFEDWRELRADAARDTRTNRVVLSFFGVFLVLAAAFVIATLIGGRALEQVRQVGLLKAVGLTPRQVAGLLVTEQLTLGLAGCVVGIVVGSVLAPAFVSSSVALLSAPSGPTFDAAGAVALILGVETVVALSALVGGARSSAQPAAHALRGGASPDPRNSSLARMGARLRFPVPVVLGLRDSFVRPARATVTALSLALSVAAAVAALSMEATLDLEDARPARVDPPAATAPPSVLGPSPAPDEPEDDTGQLRPLVYALNGLLLLVALVNLLATALLALRERVRDIGILKTVGVTPRQVTTTLTSGSVVQGALAVALGVPLGLASFKVAYALANGSTEGAAWPDWWSLVLLGFGAVVAVAAVSSVPARWGARLPIADALRFE